MSRVLLTGGSGFIAAHVLDTLLKRGHSVVTTVRSDAKGKKILEAHPEVSKDKLSYVIVEDIAVEGAFDKAVVSTPPFDAVIHTASPFHYNINDPVKDFLEPAVNGTVGILKAVKAHAPSVKSIAITSSFAAMINPEADIKVYSEEIWNPVTQEQALQPAFTYRASKTFAEKAAWDFVKTEKPNFSITTLCPPLVLGPVVHYLNTLDAINTSNARIRDFIQGKYKESVPASGTFLWVDVRDLALAHVLAVEKEAAANQRFFITAGHFSNMVICESIRKSHPEFDDKLPSKTYPDDTPADVYQYDNSKSIKVLGLTYQGIEGSVKDTVDSLVEIGV